MDSINTTSESEQMYLVTIAQLGEVVDECPIPISKVAEILNVTPISANQMIHHLEQMNLVTYTPYKGVEFTEFGWQTAKKLLRIRRLWEVFLVEHLHYAPKDAETMACKLEHAISEEAADRLAGFLNFPVVSPQGKPIPQSEGKGKVQKGIPLGRLPAGASGTVTAVLAKPVEKLYFQQIGIGIGKELKILASQENGACLIQNHENAPVSLAAELAQKILVHPEYNA